MGVFSSYNPRASTSSGVLKQAKPNVHPYPWIPLTTHTRTDSNWGGNGRVHRVQPNERGKTFSSSPLGSWANGSSSPALAPAMSSGCGGACGGCGGKKGMPVGGGVNKKP